MSNVTIESPVTPVELSRRDAPPEFDQTGEQDEFSSPVPKTAHSLSLRSAARMNAAHVSDTEHKLLLSERASLIKKKYEHGLSPAELARLEYVRWSLDRIEDAKHGAVLDRIEEVVLRYRQALHDLQSLRGTLSTYLPKGKR